jgi:hypothetical protein
MIVSLEIAMSLSGCCAQVVKCQEAVPVRVSENNRDEGGRFQPTNSDREYLEVVAAREPAGTSEIADTIGVTRQNADRRLRQLEDEGKLTSKKIGSSLAWFLAEGVQLANPVNPDDAFWEAETYAGEP